MPRPEHLPIVNTPLGIHRINEAQMVYDRDPEGWERREQAAMEQRQMEEEEMRHQERLDYEKHMQSRIKSTTEDEDELPF